jgi:4-amino-4-deoxy-L-arabinose transferase-like glycosyltransferase
VPLSKTLIVVLLSLAALVYLIGMITIDVMEVDAAQYASISRQMMDEGGYLQVHHRGEDYLDKPPLLFWLSAISMSAFGATHFAYRLPSLLFVILGAYATGRLGARLYGTATGWISALMLVTSQAMFLMAHDIRTDTILTGAVLFAVWQLKVYIDERRMRNLLLGLLGIAAALLTKGPIGLMIPVLALGTDAFARRDWKSILNWHWAVGALLVLVLLSPMLWGLYRQFGSEGIRFYFWTQSFGRITGENPWKDQSTSLYFTHTFLWAFMPWMVLGTIAIVKRLVSLLRRRLPRGTELLTLGGFLLPFVALSFSQYKLPHYIFPVLPFAAILTAQELMGLVSEAGEGKRRRVFAAVQSFILVVLWLAVIGLGAHAFPIGNVLVVLILILLAGGTIVSSMPRRSWAARFIVPSVLTMIGVNVLLNSHVYPRLLEFQAGSVVAHFIRSSGIPVDRLAFFREAAHSTEFYLGRIIPALDPAVARQGLSAEYWVFTNEEGRTELDLAQVRIAESYEFRNFHITRLNLRFLNPDTREQALSRRFLLHLLPGPPVPPE